MLLKETVGFKCENYTEPVMVPYLPLANGTADMDPFGFPLYIYQGNANCVHFLKIYYHIKFLRYRCRVDRSCLAVNARLHKNATAFTVNREYEVGKWSEIQ